MRSAAAVRPLRVLVWGTFDTGKPRTRILLSGLRDAGAAVDVLHVPVWDGVEDKAMLRGWRDMARLAWRWASAYPRLLAGYLRAERHDVVLVPYLGQLDVLLLWPFARLRGTPVVWDQFISLYDTVVDDRALLRSGSLGARLLHAWEWLACRAADRVLMDTEAHAEYVRWTFDLPDERVSAVLVGVEPESFPPCAQAASPVSEAAVAAESAEEVSPGSEQAGAAGNEEAGGAGNDRAGRPLRVLFYGQFIPLHGLETIVRAARASSPERFRWTLIGSGQEAARVRALLAEGWPSHLEWIPWVDYGKLATWICRADVCLGVFGESEKAARVIPNKVFQVVSAGRPLVTRDSRALRELFPEPEPGLYRVPPGDAVALLEALETARRERASLRGVALYRAARARITPAAIGRDLLEVLRGVSRSERRASMPRDPTSAAPASARRPRGPQRSP